MNKVINYCPINVLQKSNLDKRSFTTHSRIMERKLSFQLQLNQLILKKPTFKSVIVFSTANSSSLEGHSTFQNKFETANKKSPSFFNKNKSQTNRELNQNLIKILRLTVLQKQVKNSNDFSSNKNNSFPVDSLYLKKVNIPKVNSFGVNYRKYSFLQNIINSSFSNSTVLESIPSKTTNKTDLVGSKKSCIPLSTKYLNYYYSLSENSVIKVKNKSSVFESDQKNSINSSLQTNLRSTPIKQKSFLSYWLLPIVGFYSILSSYKSFNSIDEYSNIKQSTNLINSAKVEIHPFFYKLNREASYNTLARISEVNPNLNNQSLPKNELLTLNQIWFKKNPIRYDFIKNELGIEMDQLAISYLTKTLTPDFKNVDNSTKNLNTNKLQKNTPITHFNIGNKYRLFKSLGVINWYQLPTTQINNLQNVSLSTSEKAVKFSYLTEAVNGFLNTKALVSQLSIIKDTTNNQFSWDILNAVNSNVDKINLQKQNTLVLNNQILNLGKTSLFKPFNNLEMNVNLKKSSEQSKFTKMLSNLKLNKISFFSIKPNMVNLKFNFNSDKHTLLPKHLTLVSNINSIAMSKPLQKPLNRQESTVITLDLNFDKSSVQQFKQASLFLDNLITYYNWNITKNFTKFLEVNTNIKPSQISTYMFKTQFKENQFLSKENLLDLLNTQLSTSNNVSDQLFDGKSADNKLMSLNKINNFNKSKSRMFETKTSRAFHYELDSVFNYLNLNELNTSLANSNWTSMGDLNQESSKSNKKTFIQLKTPLVTTNSMLLNTNNHFYKKTLKLNTKFIENNSKKTSLSINKLEKPSNLAYTNVETNLNVFKQENISIELDNKTSNNFLKNWILIKTNIFNNYLKYINYKLNGFYKINNYNYKMILKKALIMNSSSNNIYSGTENISNSFNEITLKKLSINQIENGSTVNTFKLNYTDSLPIVLKHKKLFNQAQPILARTIEANNELEQNYLNSKKDLQKKHRAKKQRLESRRQKKRKRFYPRPVWLRLRLAVDLNTIKTYQKKFSLPINLQSSANFTTKWTTQETTLNNYINSLMNINKNDYLSNFSSSRVVLIPNVKTLVKSKQMNLAASLEKTFVKNAHLPLKDFSTTPISPYKKKASNYQYNNIIFNLWLSSLKKIKLFNTQVFIQKLENNLENNKELTNWNNSKVQCYTNRLNLKFSNKKQKVSKGAENILTKSIYQDLSKYAYKEKLFLSRKALVDFKNMNGKQYTVFENKSNNNPPKKTNEDNLVRDFWIWLYNLTTRNQWTNTFLANTGITSLSVPIKMSSTSTNNIKSALDIEATNTNLAGFTENPMQLKNNGTKVVNTDIFSLQQKARLLFSSNKRISKSAFQQANNESLNRIQWALNKTNLWSSTTKRVTLWSSQKLRNQSKNNKTKFIEKQIQKKINSAFSNLYLKSFLTKSNNNYYKFNITQKIHQKEQKLAYLNGVQNLNQIRFLNNSRLADLNNQKYRQFKQMNIFVDLGFISKPTIDLNWWNGININKAQLKNSLIKNGNDLTTITDLTNTFYFKTLKNIGLTSSFNKVIHDQKINAAWNSTFSDHTINLEHKTTETHIAQTLLSNNYNISLLALLFHFCALISLISISQIRCFFKFHLILVHKLSNFYLQIIYKNLAVTLKMFGNFSQNNKFSSFLKNLLTTESDITKKSSFLIPSTSHFLPKEKFLTFSNKAIRSKTKQKISLKNLKAIDQINKQFISSILNKSKENLTMNNTLSKFIYIKANSKLHKVFGLHFDSHTSLKNFKDSTKNVIYWNWTKNSSNSNSFNLRYLAERFTVKKAFKKDSSLLNVNLTKSKDITKLSSQTDKFLNKSSNLLEPNLTLKNRNNLFMLNSFMKRYFIFSNLLKLDKSITKQTTKNSKKNLELNKNLQSHEFAILSLTYQLGLTELTKQTVTSIKKGTLETTYKVVDSFEYCLKLIYSFFEKPAEFTMDWIAYAFLVEWSSDLLSFTPEKTEKQSWLAFSKVLRGSRTIFLLQNQIYGATYLNTNSGLFFLQNLVNLPINLTLGQVLYKRLLYLNDTLLEILNRPDTDLMNRQKKGTLFWDIWSDVLIKAADKYNINVPSLSNIKEEQNTLIDKVLADNAVFDINTQFNKGNIFTNSKNQISRYKLNLLNGKNEKYKQNTETDLQKAVVSPLRLVKRGYSLSTLFSLSHQQSENAFNVSTIIKSTQDVNQFVTYQSKETDLFLDYHPPKSFKHISAIRYYSMVQQPIGALVCQIYSGLLTKQIAKNVLVIGSTLSSTSDTNLERSQKTLLIQALAGETEIKIITDNASRYAIVNRGFAVGIKLLKDVFEAISLNTPCLFLLEDIHLIGERRPLLISDHGDAVGDEMSKSTETTFGAQRNGEAVHEKNQVLYQLSRHGIAHYKKPFKGDFSLSIPTNHFGFDLFLKSRYANYSSTPTNPLSYGINLIELEKTGSTGNSSNTEPNRNNLSLKLTSKRSELNFGTNQKTTLATSLQLTDNANQLLSPPSTSPFTVLLLKEQKKLKPKRIVKELPWIGLPSEQLGLLPRVSYSVRAKVAALADLGFSNMSAKLDMITDLLVIIDSVRGNRGFVVFATTHLPHILDPALRRPGRLDETISIPTLSNIWTRWEFTKAAEPIMINTNTNINFTNTNNIVGYSGTFDYLDFMNLDFIPNITGNNNFFNTIVTRFNLQNQKTNTILTQYKGVSVKSKKSTSNSHKPDHLISTITEVNTKSNKIRKNSSKEAKLELTVLLKKRYNKYLNQINQIAYYQMGKKFITNQTTFALSSFSPIYNNPTTYTSNITLTDTSDYLTNQIQYNSLYSSPNIIKKTLINLLSGKLSQLFALQTKPVIFNTLNLNQQNSEICLSEFPILSPLSVKNTYQIQSIVKHILTLYGIDETWRAATTLALSFIQKRYLYNKNLIVPKLLNFQDYSSLEEPPSPPTSNILIPAKRYENAKKALKENIERKVTASIQDKLEAHNKQSYIKTIYNINNSQTGSKFKTLLNPNINSLLSLDSYQRPLTQPSSITWHYQNKILKRHRNYLNNQWWNGQLTEHNAETLFLSDIDWRYTFIDNLNNPNLTQNNIIFFNKLKDNSNSLDSVLVNTNQKNPPTRFQDIVIDFPDADQHYNPKHRRWMLTSGDWNSWFSIDKKLQTAVFEHLIFECMIKTYTVFDQNRELLDYSASKFMKKGVIKELNTNFMFKKFGL